MAVLELLSSSLPASQKVFVLGLQVQTRAAVLAPAPFAVQPPVPNPVPAPVQVPAAVQVLALPFFGFSPSGPCRGPGPVPSPSPAPGPWSSLQSWSLCWSLSRPRPQHKYFESLHLEYKSRYSTHSQINLNHMFLCISIYPVVLSAI